MRKLYVGARYCFWCRRRHLLEWGTTARRPVSSNSCDVGPVTQGARSNLTFGFNLATGRQIFPGFFIGKWLVFQIRHIG